jgi:hypothetical protein
MGTGAGQFNHGMLDGKAPLPGCRLQTFRSGTLQDFRDVSANIANQKRCWRAIMLFGAGHKGVAAFDAVDEIVGLEELKRAIDSDGGWARASGGHAFDNVVGTYPGMTFGHTNQYITALVGQPHAFAGTGLFCVIDNAGGAAGMIVMGARE